MYITREFFLSVMPETLWHGEDLPENINLVVDSRAVKPGDFFVALHGARQDGHDFIADAVARGAVGIIMHKHIAVPVHITTLMVRDTFAACIAVARAWRQQLTLPIVGITGSVGKTSTKALLGSIVAAAGKQVFVAQGNQNTVLGIAINIFKLSRVHECAIFEMGISKKGEMAAMADLLQPTMGIITTIGHSHMAGLGVVLILLQKSAKYSNFLAPHQSVSSMVINPN